MTIDEHGVVIPELPSESTSVSMEEFNSLKSSMETKMDKLQEMILKLMEAKDISSPPKTLSSEVDKPENEEDGGKKKGVEQDKIDNPTKPPNGSGVYGAVPFPYSPDLPIPHPPIHLRGNPPKLNAYLFTKWESSMRSYVNIASIELWRIIEQGYQDVDSSNKTRREIVDCQLNATALDLIRDAVGADDTSQVEYCTTDKEEWEWLVEGVIEKGIMQRNRI